MNDALADLARQPEVAQLCRQTQQRLDDVAWHRGLLRASEDFWISVRRVCGYASAALDGARMPDDTQADPDNSAMGRLSDSGLLITAAADEWWSTFSHSPMQVWARMHSLLDNSPDRGQPRLDDVVVDPLHLPGVPSAPDMNARLLQLADAIVHSRAPAVLISAIAHAELATIRPFRNGSYLIARASSRLVLRSRGADRLGAASVEFGEFAVGRPNYVKALQSYGQGTTAGIVDYLSAFDAWVEQGIAMVDSQYGLAGRSTGL